MAELHIIDSEYQYVKDTYKSHAETTEGFLMKYFNIIDTIVTEKILQGQSADNLLNFKELVCDAIEGQLTCIMNPHNLATEQLLSSLVTDDDATL